MLEDIRLTDAEVQEGITPNFVKVQGGTWGLCSFERKLANQATSKAIKKITEWIDEWHLEHSTNGVQYQRRNCDLCWRDLKELAEGIDK